MMGGKESEPASLAAMQAATDRYFQGSHYECFIF